EGDDVSFRFYIWQLGYALFPWTGLVPAGLVWGTRRRDDARSGQGGVSGFLAMWVGVAFGPFTAELTKVPYYIFPPLSPAPLPPPFPRPRCSPASSSTACWGHPRWPSRARWRSTSAASRSRRCSRSTAFLGSFRAPFSAI